MPKTTKSYTPAQLVAKANRSIALANKMNFEMTPERKAMSEAAKKRENAYVEQYRTVKANNPSIGSYRTWRSAQAAAAPKQTRAKVVLSDSARAARNEKARILRKQKALKKAKAKETRASNKVKVAEAALARVSK